MRVSMATVVNWARGGYRKAMPRFLLLAKSGDAAAIGLVAYAYMEGLGCKQDNKKALYWYMHAYRRHNVYAAINVGIIVQGECGLNRRALQWFLKAASMHDDNAYLYIAKYYKDKLHDSNAAVKYLTKLKMSDTALYSYKEMAASTLATIHDKGKPLVSGHMNVDTVLDKAYSLWSEGHLHEAHEEFMKHARNGNSYAAELIGNFYANGIGVAVNLGKSLYWLRKAYASGSLCALSNIGVIYKCMGKYDAARKWLRKAIDSGDVEANMELAKIMLGYYEDSEGACERLNIIKNSRHVTLGTKEEAEYLVNIVKRVK